MQLQILKVEQVVVEVVVLHQVIPHIEEQQVQTTLVVVEVVEDKDQIILD